MDRSGTDRVKLLDCPAPGCFHPTFSPNGMQIAFMQDNDIHVMTLFDQTPVQITHHGYRTHSPDWSQVFALPEVTLAASEDAVIAGQAVTLTWQSYDADRADMDQSIGQVDLSGSIDVNPAATTTYTITVLGFGGYAEASVTIIVN